MISHDLNCRCTAPGSVLRCFGTDQLGLCERLCYRLRTDRWGEGDAEFALTTSPAEVARRMEDKPCS